MVILRFCLYAALLLLNLHVSAQSGNTNDSTQSQREIQDFPVLPSKRSQAATYVYGNKPERINAENCGYILRSQLVTFVNWKIASDNASGKYRIEQVSINSIPWDSVDYDLVSCLDTLFAQTDIQHLKSQIDCYLHQEFLWKRKNFKKVKLLNPVHDSKMKRGQEYWAYSIPLSLPDQAYVILKYSVHCG